MLFRSLVLIGILVGFAAGGSPATERRRAFDETRAQDLSSLAGCIASYSYDTKALPITLDELKQNSSYSYCSGRVDPETRAAYTYNILPPTGKSASVTQGSFELCADFALEQNGNNSKSNSVYAVPVDKWRIHPAGTSCDTEVVTLNRNELTNQPFMNAPVQVR